MAPVLARFILMGAALSALVACFVPGRGAALLGAVAASLFPVGLLLLAERARALPAWIALLAVSLLSGWCVTLLWVGSPRVAGLPLATWLAWSLLAGVPFVLVVFGVVLRRPES